MIKPRFTLCYLLFAICCSLFADEGKMLLVDNFNDCEFINALKGNNGIWSINSDDETQGVKATFVEFEKSDYALRLEYDIDSAFDYIFSPTYIREYSKFNIIGYAGKGIPHTSFNGFYFLLNEINITRFKYLSLDIKGDEKWGFTRRLQIELKTLDQASSFIIDGITNKWKTFLIPLTVFERIGSFKKISEMTIVFNEIATAKEGVVYLDNIYFSDGKVISPPRKNEPMEQAATSYQQQFVGKADLGISLSYDDENKTQFFHSANFIMEGESGKFSGRLKTSFEGQEFGSSVWSEETEEYPYSELNLESPSLKLPTVQVNINKISPLFSKITLGNIWIGYSQNICAPFWGWKGIKVSGRKSNFEHSTFYLKRIFDSYSVGQRGLYYFKNHRLKYVLLFHHETAKLKGSEFMDGSLKSKEFVKPISNEFSWEESLLFRFFNYKLNFELKYGKYNQKKIAQADYSNPQSPSFNYELENKEKEEDHFYKGILFLDGLWQGQKFQYSWRKFGQNFKPRYRQEPIVFEDVFADQFGQNFQIEQWYKNFYIKTYFDRIKRLTGSDFYRNVFDYEIGLLGAREFEISVARKKRKEEYEREELEISKFEKVNTTEISGKYNFIYSKDPGYRFPMGLEFLLSESRISHLRTSVKYKVQKVSLNLSYDVEEINFGLLYETKNSSNRLFEDNETKVTSYFNVRF